MNSRLYKLIDDEAVTQIKDAHVMYFPKNGRAASPH